MLDVVVADRDRVGVAERGARRPRRRSTARAPGTTREGQTRRRAAAAAALEPLRAGADRADDLGTAALDADQKSWWPVRRRGRDPAATSIPTAPAPASPSAHQTTQARRASQPVTFSLEHHGDQPLRDEVRPGDPQAAPDAELRTARRRIEVGVVVERAAPRRRARSATRRRAPGLDLDAVRDVGEPGRDGTVGRRCADGDPALRAHRRVARPTLQRHERRTHVDRMRCPDEPPDMTEGYAGHHEAPPRGGPFVNRWVLRGRSTG